jgi:hypothetical protein
MRHGVVVVVVVVVVVIVVVAGFSFSSLLFIFDSIFSSVLPFSHVPAMRSPP